MTSLTPKSTRSISARSQKRMTICN